MESGKIIKIFLLILLGIIVVVAMTLAAVFFMDSEPSSGNNSGTSKNPVTGLSDQQAAQMFNESFVRYLLYEIDAEQLHEPPLSNDYPKIEIQVDDKIFGAYVLENVVYVSLNPLPEKDIIVKTTKSEAVKMLRNKNYVTTSFNEGLSTVELVAGETTLLAKGYLKIYDKLQ